MKKTFKCPVCREDMVVKSEGFSNDGKGKEYHKTIFWCEKDDVWINQEIPKGTRPE